MNNNNEYLAHFGVKGMKWGVRRAIDRYNNASNVNERNKAMADLERHRAKAVNKIQKLDKRYDKLDAINKKETAIIDKHANKVRQKADAYRDKSYATKNKLMSKHYWNTARGLSRDASEMYSDLEGLGKEILSNRRMRQTLEMRVDQIDNTLSGRKTKQSGKEYVSKNERLLNAKYIGQEIGAVVGAAKGGSRGYLIGEEIGKSIGESVGNAVNRKK